MNSLIGDFGKRGKLRSIVADPQNINTLTECHHVETRQLLDPFNRPDAGVIVERAILVPDVGGRRVAWETPVQGHSHNGIEVLTIPVGSSMALEGLQDELGLEATLREGCQNQLNITALKTGLDRAGDLRGKDFETLE